MFLFCIRIFRFMYSFTGVDNRFVLFRLLSWTENRNVVIFLNRQKKKIQ